MPEAALGVTVLKMEGESTSQARWAATGSGKRQEGGFLLTAFGRDQPCQHLQPGETDSILWLPKL